MNRTISIILAIALSLECAGQTFYAHRGGRMENDENTLQAFKQCISVGVDRFETDVRSWRRPCMHGFPQSPEGFSK